MPFQQNEVQKAVSVLVKCARHKFAAVSEPHDGQIHSLATVPSEDQGADLVALYRRLLLQPLPYDYKCPPLMPGVNPQSLDGEKLFLWLSYWYVLIREFTLYLATPFFLVYSIQGVWTGYTLWINIVAVTARDQQLNMYRIALKKCFIYYCNDKWRLGIGG